MSFLDDIKAAMREASNRRKIKGLEVRSEGDPEKSWEPDRIVISSKKTGKKWFVEFDSVEYDQFATPRSYALLKDENGELLERRGLSQSLPGENDVIDVNGSPYKSVWDVVSKEFNRFQDEYHRFEKRKSENRKEAERRIARQKMDGLSGR